MGENKYQDLIAWQTGDAFKREVTRIVLSSPRAAADLRYRSQILSAAQSVPVNIAEGFLRKSPGDFRRFLAVSLGSLGETESRLRDGIELSYFTADECAAAFRLGRRCAMASVGLRKSQLEFMKRPPPRKAPAR
jgi:four helix bundle protein